MLRYDSHKRIDWPLHAHRRTFATVAMEVGVLEEIVGRLLNHTPISITGQRYTRLSLEALRPAMQVACCELERRIQLAGSDPKTQHRPLIGGNAKYETVQNGATGLAQKARAAGKVPGQQDPEQR